MEKKESYKYMFSIFDDVTKLYEPPFVDMNKGSAMRRIQDLMQTNPQSTYSKFPHDYKLMCIGTWNEETANVYTDGADQVVDLQELTPTKE